MIKMLPINAWLKEQYLLSSAGDNLIEKRDDGLYYGITPPVNTAKLYVDAVAGNDNNIGNSPNSPLKTVYAALRRQKENQFHTIHLKEGQVHIIDKRDGRPNVDVFSNRYIDFMPYGPTWKDSARRNIDGSAVFKRAKDFNRPTLKFINSFTNNASVKGKKNSPATVFVANNKLIFEGIIIDSSIAKERNDNILLDAVQPCFIGNRDSGNNQIDMIGCELKLGVDYGLFASGSGNNLITLDCCNIVNKQPNQFFVRTFDEGSLKFSSRYDGFVNHDWTGWSTGANAQVTRRHIDTLPKNEWKNYFKGSANEFKTILANPGFGF